MNKYVLVVVLFLSVLFSALNSSAQDSNETPPQRFQPFIGVWTITEPTNSPLRKVRFSITNFGGGIVNLTGNGTGLASGRFLDVPLKINGRKRRFKADYGSLFGDATRTIGTSGKVIFEVPPGNTFQSLIITFVPDDPNLRRVSVRAERTGENVNNGRTIIHKFRLRGNPKPGKTININLSVINRGPSLIQEDQMTTLFLVNGPVENLRIKRFKKMSGCIVRTFFGVPSVICNSGYLGAPIRKRGDSLVPTSIGKVKFAFEIKEDPDKDTIALTVDSGSASSDDLDIESRERKLNLKIEDSGVDLELLGLFTRDLGVPPATYNFRSESGVINGYIFPPLSGTEKSLGYKVGDKIFRNYVKRDGRYLGEIAVSRSNSGVIKYASSPLVPKGKSFFSQFGNKVLTKK